MSDAPLLVRTNLYLSHYVWGQLKLAAFDEHSTANDIINAVVEAYLLDRSQYIPVSIHRSHNKDEGRQPRTIRFRPELWTHLQQLSQREHFSLASLVENLLIQRLGIQAQPESTVEEVERKPQVAESNRYVRVGGEIYDLGENPFVIDLNGNPPEKRSKKSADHKTSSQPKG